MENVDSMLDGEMDRRTFVTAAALGVSSLAGCVGAGDEQPESSAGNESAEQTGGTDNQPSNTDSQQEVYPSHEPQSDTEEMIISNAKSNQKEYAIKIEDFKFINKEDVESSEAEEINTYSEALDKALTPNLESQDSLWIYFTEPTSGQVDFLRNAERDFSEYVSNPPGTVSGWSEEFDEETKNSGADPELAESEYGEFISERLDGEGVVNHAGEIPDYAREALESGWQA